MSWRRTVYRVVADSSSCSRPYRVPISRCPALRFCSRSHGTTVQAPIDKVPHREIKMGDLREAANTDGIVEDLIRCLVSGNQSLTSAATHLFSGGGKYLRPTCVMLMGECCNDGAPTNHKQRDIALITELIHVASLVHDDVLDSAATRRALATVNALFNEKVAILSGDFIIARATSKLANLGCSETITILSSVIRDLIKGEILQLKRDGDMFSTYLDKTYLKTASLIAHGCQAVAVNSANPQLQHIAYNYGKNLGIAFQLVDDMLDFVATSQELGKAAGGSDLKLGLATAPVLYASLEHPHIVESITRGFSKPGDVDRALDCVSRSEGVEKTRELALRYCNLARDSLELLPPGDYNLGLAALCDIVLNRTS